MAKKQNGNENAEQVLRELEAKQAALAEARKNDQTEMDSLSHGAYARRAT